MTFKPGWHALKKSRNTNAAKIAALQEENDELKQRVKELAIDYNNLLAKYEQLTAGEK